LFRNYLLKNITIVLKFLKNNEQKLVKKMVLVLLYPLYWYCCFCSKWM